MTRAGEALYLEAGGKGDLAFSRGRRQGNCRRSLKRSLGRKAPWVRLVVVAFASSREQRP
jgi:hypothetical protein